MTHANMLSIATKTWGLAAEGSEVQYRQMVVKEWVEQRAQDIICIMEDNVEARSESNEPLWGSLDYKYERLKVFLSLSLSLSLSFSLALSLSRSSTPSSASSTWL